MAEKELEEMENVEGTEKTRKSWAPKPLTEEQINSVKKAIATCREHGVSETMDKVFDAVIDWRNEDKNVQSENRKALAKSLGENMKDLLAAEDFQAEVNDLKGIELLAQLVGQIVSYNCRKTYTPRPKVKNITIQGKLYSVNAEFLEEIKNEPDTDKRRQMLLEHPDTKIKNDIEEF